MFAIEEFMGANNANPKSSVCTKNVAAVLKKVARRKIVTVTLHEPEDGIFNAKRHEVD